MAVIGVKVHSKLLPRLTLPVRNHLRNQRAGTVPQWINRGTI